MDEQRDASLREVIEKTEVAYEAIKNLREQYSDIGWGFNYCADELVQKALDLLHESENVIKARYYRSKCKKLAIKKLCEKLHVQPFPEDEL